MTSTQIGPGAAREALGTAGARQPAGRPAARPPLGRRGSLRAYLSLIPAFLLVALVVWYPVSQSLYHGFTKWNGATSTWIGWKNYERIFSSGEIWLLLRNNFIFVFAVPGILLISLIVTVLVFE